MTAAASKAADGEIVILLHQAHIIHQAVRANLDGLTQEDSLVQPQPGGNCLNWVLGHLLCVYDLLLPFLGQTPVMGTAALKRYDRGTPGIRDSGEALDLKALTAAWDEASKRVDAGLAGLSSHALDAPAPFSPGNNPNETVRSLLSAVFFHQAYHAGQTGILRRVAGKDGAIR